MSSVNLFTLDKFVWHGGASVGIPFLIIHQIGHAALALLKKAAVANTKAKLAASIISLASIPFIIEPIDHFVDWGMDLVRDKYIPLPNPDKETTKVNVSEE
jgi:hypothetical protein